MKSLERFLIGLDSRPGIAISRTGIGLGIVPVFRASFGSDTSVWTFLAFFIGLLVMLRVVPAVLRHALPFSAEAQETWAKRRALAKRYDSYQWQKLFWIGLGMLTYIATAGQAQNYEFVVTIICLIGGSIGMLIWRNVDRMPSAQ